MHLRLNVSSACLLLERSNVGGGRGPALRASISYKLLRQDCAARRLCYPLICACHTIHWVRAAFLNEEASFASWSRSINQMSFIPRKQVSGLHLIKPCFQSGGSFFLLQFTSAAGSYQAVGHNGVWPRWHAANPNEPRRMTSTGLADYCVILLGPSGIHALFYYSPRKGVEVEENGQRPAAHCMYEQTHTAVFLVPELAHLVPDLC